MAFLPSLWIKSSIAPCVEGAGRFSRVIHPFHPLFGQEFELISYSHSWGEERVSFHDQEGRLRSLPAIWTSVAAPDPFVVISAGRSLFRVKELLVLASLLRELSRSAATDQSVKEFSPDM